MVRLGGRRPRNQDEEGGCAVAGGADAAREGRKENKTKQEMMRRNSNLESGSWYDNFTPVFLLLSQFYPCIFLLISS